jgi:hypothetical protein
MHAQYVAKVGAGKATHGIKGGEWSYTRTNHTVCGKEATAVEHMHSGAEIEITCKSCIKSMPRTLTIEVTTVDVSYYTEDDTCPEDEREQCGGECRYMDGDKRTIRDHGTSEYEIDADDIELSDGDPVAAAVEFIRKNAGDAIHASSTPIADVRAHEWLSGSYDHPYREETRETSVRLSGDWTTAERTAIFQTIANHK